MITILVIILVVFLMVKVMSVASSSVDNTVKLVFLFSDFLKVFTNKLHKMDIEIEELKYVIRHLEKEAGFDGCEPKRP